MCSQWRRTARAQPAACLVTCSGPRSVRRRDAFARCRQTLARAESVSAQPRTVFRYRCNRYVRIKISVTFNKLQLFEFEELEFLITDYADKGSDSRRNIGPIPF